MCHISFKNVWKSFGDLHVLRNLSLQVEKGDSLVIIGGSGTGKSVLLKCLQGFLTPEQGQIFIEGQDVLQMEKKRRQTLNQKIGMLFQNGALFDSLSVFDNVAFGLVSGQGMSRRESEPVVYACLKKVGLHRDVAKKFPADISGGMRKRVSLARAIATSPSIMLFDEPTTGLDPISSTTINTLILQSVRELNMTAITITHDIHSARHIADKIAFLYDGDIVWTGTVAEMEQTKNPYIKQFINGAVNGPITWAKV